MKEVQCFRFTVKSSKNYNKMIFLSMSNFHTHMRRESSPPPSSTPYPPLPSRLVLTTLAVWLSHTDVISSPTSEAYGNVTGRRWTRWLLTHSSPPRGRTLRCTSPRWKDWCGSKQEAGCTDRCSHTCTSTYIQYISFYTSFVKLVLKLVLKYYALAPFGRPWMSLLPFSATSNFGSTTDQWKILYVFLPHYIYFTLQSEILHTNPSTSSIWST